MHLMNESEIACLAGALASTPGYTSSLLGGRVPPHPAVRDTIDTEVEYRVKKVTEKFSECLHIVANEPSLALFRIQEHVRKSLPKLAQSKVDLTQLKQDVQGTCYDVDYATKTVREMHNSKEPLSSIEALVKRAIASKKRLNAQAAEKWEVLDVGGDSSSKEGSKIRRSPVPFTRTPSPTNTPSSPKTKPTTSAKIEATLKEHTCESSDSPEKQDKEKSEAVDIPTHR